MVSPIGVNWEPLPTSHVYLNGLDTSLEFLLETVLTYVIKTSNSTHLNHSYDGTYIRYTNIFAYKLVLQ